MSRKFLIGLCAPFAVLAFATLTVGQAPGAWLRIQKAKPTKAEAFLAIYGFPGESTTAEVPIGGGLGRNYGFGQNMLFQGNLSVVLTGGLAAEACAADLGGTLLSNNTGKNNPLGIGIGFADLQCAKVNGVRTSIYADTQDQVWTMEVCGPGAKECKPEPLHNVGELEEDTVKIENVALDVGPGTVLQGTVWGKWINGSPPMIELKNKPAKAAESENLVVTQAAAGAKVGETAKEVKGNECLVSANNSFNTSSEKFEPQVEITE